MLQFRDFIIKRFSITPDSGAYADHDQIGAGVNTISGVFSSTSKKAEILSVSVHDSTTQGAALTLHFFRDVPTNSTADNAHLAITDAELAAKWVGKVEIPAAAYQSVVTGGVATVNNIGLLVYSAAGVEDLLVLVESAGTPTYGAAQTLTFVIGLSRG
jgi:hypothetical protein